MVSVAALPFTAKHECGFHVAVRGFYFNGGCISDSLIEVLGRVVFVGKTASEERDSLAKCW